MDLSKLTMGEKVVAGAGIPLAVDLAFFPWHYRDLGFQVVRATGIESPNALWGVLALELAVGLVAVVLVSRFSTARLPVLWVPWSQAMFYGGAALVTLLLFKLALETNYLGFGAWVALLLGAGVAYGAFLIRQEAGPATERPPSGSTGI